MGSNADLVNMVYTILMTIEPVVYESLYCADHSCMWCGTLDPDNHDETCPVPSLVVALENASMHHEIEAAKKLKGIQPSQTKGC